MSQLIWRPMCPVCHHPQRIFTRNVQVECHLDVSSSGEVILTIPNVLLDVIGKGLQPEDITCAFCQS